MSSPSLCIPRVFSNISKERILRVFNELNLGKIDKIETTPVNSSQDTIDKKKFNRVFIHFSEWGTSENAIKARKRIINGDDIKIIYDDPWFWKVYANHSLTRVKSTPQLPKLPRLVIEEEEQDDKLLKKKYSNNDKQKRLAIGTSVDL